MIYLKRQEYVNKRVCSNKPVFKEKKIKESQQGKKRNIEAQKREQRHRQVKGVRIHGDTKERQENKCGSYWMGKRRKPEETADIKI